MYRYISLRRLACGLDQILRNTVFDQDSMNFILITSLRTVGILNKFQKMTIFTKIFQS
jgi:hypothetical protein